MPQVLADTFGALVRLFFSRFFDKESLSPQGDAEANVVQTLGMLAAPGGLISRLSCTSIRKSSWAGAWFPVRCLFLSASMAVIAFIVVFEWDALFLDRRDYQVLLPLPLLVVEIVFGEDDGLPGVPWIIFLWRHQYLRHALMAQRIR